MFPFQEFIQFKNNPMQYMMNKGIQLPQNCGNNPEQIIQSMMNNGFFSQQQYNQAANLSNQLQKNPQFMQFLNKYISQ